MADGVDITPGSGVKVETDEVTTVNGGAVSARQIQRMKLDSVGADGAHRDSSKDFPFPVYAPNQKATGNLTALNSEVVIVVKVGGDVAIDILVAGLVGTIQFQMRVTGGTWYAANATLSATSGPTPTYVNPASGCYLLTAGARDEVKVIVTAYTSGSAAVISSSSSSANGIYANQILPMKLFDGTNSVAIKAASTAAVAADPALVVALSPNSPMPTAAAPATYSASIVGLATAVSATDIFTITGSASKTVRVTRIVVNGVQTTAAQVNVLIVKRSTANSAGTSTAPTRVPYDSTNAAVTATVLAYTANPTLGTAVGTGSARRAFIPGAATASDAQGLEIISGDVGQQTMTLRGVAEVLAVNLNATTVAGSALNITIEWTEI